MSGRLGDWGNGEWEYENAVGVRFYSKCNKFGAFLLTLLPPFSNILFRNPKLQTPIPPHCDTPIPESSPSSIPLFSHSPILNCSPNRVDLGKISSSPMPQDLVHNIIIVGSGPAGYTAALYAARADLNPLVFAGIQPGGQLMITTDVENYPGFPEGIMGPELMELFRKQCERFGASVEYKEVEKVDLNKRPFEVWSDGELYRSRAIIVATGASAKWIGIESEVFFGGYGVSACATCDGFFFRGKEVIVVGGGDTAMEEANYLTRHASKVYLVHRRDSFRASKIMQDRVLANPKVEVLYNTVLDEIIGDHEPIRKVRSARLRNIETNSLNEMPIDGVFVAIGHRPNSDLFKEWLDMDELGYIKAMPNSSKTKIPGVFVAGDVADSIYRQAVTAAGTGCMAAIDAERFLEAEGH